MAQQNKSSKTVGADQNVRIENYIDCRQEDKTVVGQFAHDLYFRDDYHKEQSGDNLFAVYYVGEDKSELRACQTTLEGALSFMGAYCVLIMLRPSAQPDDARTNTANAGNPEHTDRSPSEEISGTRKASSAIPYANRSYPNTGGWQDRHDAALFTPQLHSLENPISEMVIAWATYARLHKARYESTIGEDYVLGPEWQKVGEGLLGLLNGDLGRLDGGTLDAFIRNTISTNGGEDLA